MLALNEAVVSASWFSGFLKIGSEKIELGTVD
jgi:hypothetical protein